MAQRVFFLNTLREGVQPRDYEHWVRTVDYPIARRQTEINSYVVTRLEGHLSGDDALPCQYLEVLEMTDIDDYRDMAGTNDEFRDSWMSSRSTSAPPSRFMGRSSTTEFSRGT